MFIFSVKIFPARCALHTIFFIEIYRNFIVLYSSLYFHNALEKFLYIYLILNFYIYLMSIYFSRISRAC